MVENVFWCKMSIFLIYYMRGFRGKITDASKVDNLFNILDFLLTQRNIEVNKPASSSYS